MKEGRRLRNSSPCSLPTPLYVLNLSVPALLGWFKKDFFLPVCCRGSLREVGDPPYVRHGINLWETSSEKLARRLCHHAEWSSSALTGEVSRTHTVVSQSVNFVWVRCDIKRQIVLQERWSSCGSVWCVRPIRAAVLVTLQQLLLETNGACGIPFMTRVKILFRVTRRQKPQWSRRSVSHT